MKRSGFVSIIGKPNVGKSTLLNYLVGQKLAGVSPKPQTTRGMVRGILTENRGQVCFLDTPGFHEPRDLLGSWMISEIRKSLDGADLIYWMVLPASADEYEKQILELLKTVEVPVFLLVNQIDRFPKPEILPVLDQYHKAFAFREMIPISAKDGTQIGLLLAKTFENLPEGEGFFPKEQISDQSERFLVTEIIREKIFRFTGKEIPYGTTVMIETFKERDDGMTEIHASIIVEKESQKAIVIGAKGQKLKMIGQTARHDIEALIDRKVFLKLWVKTLRHWKRDQTTLRELGFE